MTKTALTAAIAGSLFALSFAPAMAADAIRPAPTAVAPYVPVPVVAAASDVWSGFYAGGHLGVALPDNSVDSERWFGGVHAGYNIQNGNFVVDFH